MLAHVGLEPTVISDVVSTDRQREAGRAAQMLAVFRHIQFTTGHEMSAHFLQNLS